MTGDVWKPLRAGPFMDGIGPILRLRRPGPAAEAGSDSGGDSPPAPARYALQTGAGHANLTGSVHGGVTAALIDHAMAVEAWEIAGRRPVATVQAELRYLAPARPGARIEAEVRPTHRAGSLIFLETRIEAEGRTLAAATAIFKILRPKAEPREERT